MEKKTTWETIYKDFRNRHPNLRKLLTRWCPHSYATIELYFSDGKRGLYNYETKRVTFIV